MGRQSQRAVGEVTDTAIKQMKSYIASGWGGIGICRFDLLLLLLLLLLRHPGLVPGSTRRQGPNKRLQTSR
jgi:hypothetical protein